MTKKKSKYESTVPVVLICHKCMNKKTVAADVYRKNYNNPSMCKCSRCGWSLIEMSVGGGK